MPGFKEYIRIGLTSEMRRYVTGEDISNVSVSPEDHSNGSPMSGDMIARNPSNHSGMWLVSLECFLDNFNTEPLN